MEANGFSSSYAQIEVSFCFKRPLESVKAFLSCFPVYWGDHTRLTRAPVVVPWGFRVNPKSLMTDDKQSNADGRSQQHLSIWSKTRGGLGRREQEQRESEEGCWGEGGEKGWERQRGPRRRLLQN